MQHPVALPALDEAATAGTVIEWFVDVGQHVDAGDTLVSVGLDKVDVDVPAPVSGTLTAIEAQPGEDVAVGEVLGILGT